MTHRTGRRGAATLCVLLFAAPQAFGGEEDGASRAQDGGAPAPNATDPAPYPAEGAPSYEAVVRGRKLYRGATPGRESTVVTRREIQERLPRSAPDALRYEPGVFVQQTAHAQGSAFIRGRTGQQTVMLFDGVRLNNSTYRQGPNQYFFTIDARTVETIEVVRGGASTLYGSDAIGGVLYARPIEPVMDPQVEGVRFYPRVMARAATADKEIGGRLQMGFQYGQDLGAMGGVSYRDVGLLTSGGPVYSSATGEQALVPRFLEDGRTQLGTGFRELTTDARAVYHLGAERRLVIAFYDYRQFDAPRTDQCPPPFASRSECLMYEEQFRTLAYAAFEGDLGRWAKRSRATVSYQLQHERRARDRPKSFIVNGGRDDVATLGLSTSIETGEAHLTPAVLLKLSYGGDVYHDVVDSAAWVEFTDLSTVIRQSRGQYLDGSSYTWGGLFLQPACTLFDRLTLTAGGRLTAVYASAPADPQSGTREIDRGLYYLVGNAGMKWSVRPQVAVLANVDRSFRAPNLDDLTSRQQTGPGFQFENADLKPETALTYEVGLQVSLAWLDADLWGFYAQMHDAIERRPRGAADCPPQTPQCNNSWNRYQLVNLASPATIYGVEGMIKVYLPWHLDARATVAYAFGEGPNPQDRPNTPGIPYEENVPLSRIPPLNGTFDLMWRPPWGLYAGPAIRWAFAQDRLSLGDRSDARIPTDGTPGFIVCDFRAGVRFGSQMHIGLVFENMTDAAYRYHGSSVNGPGRGIIFSFEVGR